MVMQYKKMIVAVLSMGMMVLSACGNTEQTEAPTEQAQTSEVRSKEIFSGSYSDDDTFLQSYKLSKDNGNYVNFWIDNTGERSVTIRIDEKGDTEIKAGESGHISAKVGGLKKYYDFMAVPSDGNGGTITFEYDIKQTDEE